MEALFNSNTIIISLDQHSDHCELIAIHIVVFDDLSFDSDHIRIYQTESFSVHPWTLMVTAFYFDNWDRYRKVVVHLP